MKKIRVHLSTAVVMTVTIGFMMYLNFNPGHKAAFGWPCYIPPFETEPDNEDIFDNNGLYRSVGRLIAIPVDISVFLTIVLLPAYYLEKWHSKKDRIDKGQGPDNFDKDPNDESL